MKTTRKAAVNKDVGLRVRFMRLGAMKPDNPYSPPTVDCKAENIAPAFLSGRHAAYFLGASVTFSLVYTFLDEAILRTSFGAWPMLFITASLAIGSVLITRDLLLSPLCCIAGTISGDILAGFIRNWAYAQMQFCIPLAIGFSVPALIIGLVLRQRRASRLKIMR